MSIETGAEQNSPEDLEAARALIAESETLRTDDYARDVFKKGGLTSSGKIVDIRKFLAAREAYLDDNADKMAALGETDPALLREAMLVHSDRPDLEEK